MIHLLENRKSSSCSLLIFRAFGNAIQDDLWQFLTKQAEVDKVPLPGSVKEIMDTWTLKMGKYDKVPFARFSTNTFLLQ